MPQRKEKILIINVFNFIFNSFFVHQAFMLNVRVINDDGIKNVVDVVLIVDDILSGNTACEEESIQGCLDPQACNYDSSAVVDNGSCQYLDCTGEWWCSNMFLGFYRK